MVCWQRHAAYGLVWSGHRQSHTVTALIYNVHIKSDTLCVCLCCCGESNICLSHDWGLGSCPFFMSFIRPSLCTYAGEQIGKINKYVNTFDTQQQQHKWLTHTRWARFRFMRWRKTDRLVRVCTKAALFFFYFCQIRHLSMTGIKIKINRDWHTGQKVSFA